MIPFRDENPTRTIPIITVGLIAANVAVFLYQAILPEGRQLIFVYTHAAIPTVLLGQESLAEAMPRALVAAARSYSIPITPLQPIWLTVFTSMFLHGGLFHLGSNMLYLWIFGNNVEAALGHARYLAFYLICGLIAATAQILFSLGSAIPMVGASGAIAGVLGAYYVRYPHARVQCLVFLLFLVTVVWLPASLVLLLWFLLQVLNSLGVVGRSGQGGVAFFAHIGGFVAGWLLVRWFEPRRRIRRAVF